MKQIPLTQGQFAIVDDHWFDYLNQWKWHANWDESTQGYYAVRWEGSGKYKKLIRMHRVIMKTPDGMECDHIHHITLDNREDQLRNVTKSQNMMNKRLHKNNSTGVRGVSMRPENRKYRAILTFQGKNVLNKTFTNFEDAVVARKEAEKKYHSEYSYQESI